MASVLGSVTLATSTLPTGTHDIGLRVQDSEGNWSNTVLRRITVRDDDYQLAGGLDRNGTADQNPDTFVGTTAAEYFIDADPGVGAATALSIDSTVGAASLLDAVTLATSTLPTGTHDIGLRVQDSEGNWSNTVLRRITVRDDDYQLAGGLDRNGTADQNPDTFVGTTAAEYFIDADPGVGAATALSIDSTMGAASLLDAFTLATSTLPTGTHDIGLRVQDSEGNWSNTVLRRITVRDDDYQLAGGLDRNGTADQNPDTFVGTTAAEYFIDADPGVGAATALSIDSTMGAASLLDAVTLATSTLPTGTHDIGLRVQDSLGNWSNTVLRRITVRDDDYQLAGGLDRNGTADQNPDTFVGTTAAEYFIDADPGVGAATALSIDSTVGAASLLDAFTLATSTLPTGTHDIGLRVQDSEGNWSNTVLRRITVRDDDYQLAGGLDRNGTADQNPDTFVGTTAAEYFIDADPGVGAATALSIDSTMGAASLLDAVTLATSTLPTGTHDIGLRVQDSLGNWSNTVLRRITVRDDDYQLAGGLDRNGTADQNPDTFVGTTAAEYFIDADPGVGAATALSIDSTVGAASLLDAVTLATSTLPTGTHDIGLRVQDSEGNWSNTVLRRIRVLSGALVTIDTVSKSTVSAGESYDITITSNIDWTVTESLDWASVSLSSGSGDNTVTVTVDANTTTRPRSGTITIGEQAHSLSQEAAAAFVTIDPILKTAVSGGESYDITVTSNTDWTVVESLDWASVSLASGSADSTVTVTVDANTTTSPRSGTITIGGQAHSLSQNGAAAFVTIDPSLKTAVSAGESYDITITSNTDWTATESLDWASVSLASGSGDSTVTVTVDANLTTSPRSGTISIGEQTHSLSQNGAAAFVTIDPSLKTAVSAGESYDITVTSNTDWTATESLDWASVSLASGSGDSTVTVTVDANLTTSPRSGTITIGGEAHSLSQNGAAAFVTIDPSSKTAVSGGESYDITVTSNTDWTATESLDWASVSLASGSGDSTVTVTVDANLTTSPRSGTITIGGEAHSLSQNGAAAFVTIDPSLKTAVSAGESYDITVTSNTDWTATESLDWASVSPASGSGDGTVTVTVDGNIAFGARSGTITIGGELHTLVQDGTDTDSDGLLDSYEQTIIDADLGDAIDSLDDVLPGDDFDGDGRTNLEEQNDGTDPIDAGSYRTPPETTWYAGASYVSDGWRYFGWFKGFKPAGANWIYHGRHGWLYTLGADTSSLFLWDVALGRWMFTNETAYPWIYAYGPDGGWVFFFEGGRPGSRYFKRGDNGQTLSEQQLRMAP